MFYLSEHVIWGSVFFLEQVLKSVALPLAPNVTLLCREVVDLLKNMDRCQILLTKFIPAYHHHFGRQCRVADYGYTKLLDLFEAISHVVQVSFWDCVLIVLRIILCVILSINLSIRINTAYVYNILKNIRTENIPLT